LGYVESMTKKPVSTKDIVALLGGVKSVADLTGRTRNATSNWLRAQTFPSNTYIVMSRALAERGHTAPPSLWGMYEAPPSGDSVKPKIGK
jgi:hypothetical protein